MLYFRAIKFRVSLAMLQRARQLVGDSTWLELKNGARRLEILLLYDHLFSGLIIHFTHLVPLYARYFLRQDGDKPRDGATQSGFTSISAIEVKLILSTLVTNARVYVKNIRVETWISLFQAERINIEYASFLQLPGDYMI